MADPDAPRRLYRNARREAFIVALVWAAAFAWSVGYCYLFGFHHEETSLVVRWGLAEKNPQPGLVLGFPDWIFWGIVVPWVLTSIFTVWFGMKGIADDDLGADAPETDDQGGNGHGH